MTIPGPAAQPKIPNLVWGWLFFVVAETATQIAFKLAGAAIDPSVGIGPMLLHAAATPVVWIGFALYFSVFICWMTILKDVDLGRAFPMTAAAYLATLSAAVLFFHEHLNPVRIGGVVVIIAGIALLASDRNSPKPLKGPVQS